MVQLLLLQLPFAVRALRVSSLSPRAQLAVEHRHPPVFNGWAPSTPRRICCLDSLSLVGAHRAHREKRSALPPSWARHTEGVVLGSRTVGLIGVLFCRDDVLMISFG